MRKTTTITICFFCTAIVLTSVSFGQQYQVKYFFNENFGGLPITDSFGISLNDLGQVALQVSTHPTSPIRYQQATYSSTNGYQALGLFSDGFSYNYINNLGVVVGKNEYGGSQSAYRHQNGTLEVHDIGYTNPFFLGLNNQGVAYGHDWDSDSVFWTDFNSSGTVTVNGQRPDWVFGLSDDGLMGLQVGSHYYLHPLNSSEYRPIVSPDGFSNPHSDTVRMTDGGFISGSISNIDTSEKFYAAWNLDGSFNRILGPEGDVPYAIFNDLGQAVGLNFANQPMYFDSTSWKSIVFDDLQGGEFFSIFDFNNRGEFVGGMLEVPNSRPGYWTGFYASVVPEPSSGCLMAVAIMLGCFYRNGSQLSRRNTTSKSPVPS